MSFQKACDLVDKILKYHLTAGEMKLPADDAGLLKVSMSTNQRSERAENSSSLLYSTHTTNADLHGGEQILCLTGLTFL